MEKSIKDQEGANLGNYADIRIKKCQVSLTHLYILIYSLDSEYFQKIKNIKNM